VQVTEIDGDISPGLQRQMKFLNRGLKPAQYLKFAGVDIVLEAGNDGNGVGYVGFRFLPQIPEDFVFANTFKTLRDSWRPSAGQILSRSWKPTMPG
jgi:hypothetical protein